MRSRWLLIPIFVAATAAMAHDAVTSSSQPRSADGQIRAAALLAGQQKVEVVLNSASAVAASKKLDAQAQAAALLSHPR